MTIIDTQSLVFSLPQMGSGAALPLCLFVIGVVGFVLYRSNALILLLALELILLSITLLVLIACMTYDDAAGQTIGIMYVCIAGAESAIGLSVLVAYYRLRGNVSLTKLICT